MSQYVRQNINIVKPEYGIGGHGYDKVEIKIVSSANSNSTAIDVNAYLRGGWNIVQGLNVTQGRDNVMYTVVMARYNKERDNEGI